MQTSRFSSFVPFLAILGAVLALALGSSLAKSTLFPAVGAEGTTALRVGFSAAVMMLLWRPWRWQRSRADIGKILAYGCGLGGMNLFFYMALQRIPFGVAVAIEFSGPLAVALFGSRRPIDFLWVALAVLGLGLLLPLGLRPSELDPTGVLFALVAGAFWAAYILFGKGLGHLHTKHAVPLGMSVAALMVAPVGIVQAGSALLSPWVLVLGLVVGVVSSAIPILLEMMALKRLSSQAFGIMVSMEPAVAALVAWVLLNEHLSPSQWLAIGLVMTASMGCAWTAQARRA